MSNKVLIVDDDDSVLTMLYKVIKSNGIDADTSSSGESALALIAEHPYDLILLDINMQGMDGFQVIEAIRKQGIKTPVIILSNVDLPLPFLPIIPTISPFFILKLTSFNALNS